jgi:hypothetical protein
MKQITTGILYIALLLAATFSLADAATISGTISLEGGGHPLTGEVSITYVSADNAGSGCDAWGGYVQTPGYDETTGEYTLTGLLPGSYYIYFQQDGVNLVKEWSSALGSSENCLDALQILVVTGDDLTGYDFELAPGGTLRGVVQDEFANPISGVQVNIFELITTPCSVFSPTRGYQFSDSDGSFEVTGLPLNTTYFAAAMS